MKNNKIASITLPVYNAMPALVDTVESVLNQSYTEFDFIVIDDGSTDDSFQYLSSINDKRIRLLKQENRGLGYTLNKLFELATTKYVLRLDADDICDKNRLEHQIEFMESNPDVVMSGTDINFICGDKKVKSQGVILKHEAIVQKLLLKRFSICHPTIIVQRAAFNKIGGYKIEGAGEDLDFFLRMTEVGKVANVNKVLLSYRLSFDSLSMRKRNELHLGYDYAIQCYRNKQKGLPEPDFGAFSNKRIGLYYQICNYADELSEKFYRKSIFLKSNNRTIPAKYFLSLAALLRPKTTFFHIRQRVITLFNSSSTVNKRKNKTIND